MSDIQAAVGVAQLGRIDAIIRKRRAQARMYTDLLAELRLPLSIQSQAPWAFSTFQSFVINFAPSARVRRNDCIDVLKEKYGIETQVGTYSLSSEPAFADAAHSGKISNGPTLYRNTLTLPLFDSITENEQHYVVESLAAVLRPAK